MEEITRSRKAFAKNIKQTVWIDITKCEKDGNKWYNVYAIIILV